MVGNYSRVLLKDKKVYGFSLVSEDELDELEEMFLHSVDRAAKPVLKENFRQFYNDVMIHYTQCDGQEEFDEPVYLTAIIEMDNDAALYFDIVEYSEHFWCFVKISSRGQLAFFNTLFSTTCEEDPYLTL